MIKSKSDLEKYQSMDMRFYRQQDVKTRRMCRLTQDPVYLIDKYVTYLRREEYFYNTRKGKWGTMRYLAAFRKKNKLGNKLGFKIPKNCFGPGLTIYHHGEIIVNETARIGAFCTLHGSNCIGNNGIQDKSPVIGDKLDLGIGAKVIGDVHLGNSVRVGANAVVISSFEQDGITLVGVPAVQK
ncbi:MAG: serine acetyltransferase [Lachnospiraceae bacterium]|nr:serine acetyltransferase [Lachnospiraceae bacterium]